MATTTEKNPARRVRTPEFRMSFPSLLKPRQNDEGGERYELTMLFPPGFDKKPFVAALKAAMADKYGADMKKWPKLRRGADDVIRDFNDYNNNSNKPLAGDWRGWTMVRANASTKVPPVVVGSQKGPNGVFPVISDEREVYGGRWAKAIIEAYVYDRKDGKGVTFGLGNVQLLKNDKKFGMAASVPEQDFEDASDEWAGAADAFDSGAQTQEAATDEDAPW